MTAVVVLDGPSVITGGEDGVVNEWHGGQPQRIATAAPVRSLAAGRFGGRRVVAAGRADGTLEIFAPDAGQALVFETGSAPVGAVALAVRDGRLTAVVGDPGGRLRDFDLDAELEDAGPQSDKVEWLSDAPADEDLLRRRPLARALALTLEDVLVPFDVLALWAILSTRWPMLADRLREHPEEIDLVGTEALGVPEDVRALLRSREVAEVVRFPSGGPLTRELIEECVTGRSST